VFLKRQIFGKIAVNLLKMNKKILFALLLLSFLQSCVLHSVTLIESSKTFVLGEGKHGRYNASIKNIGVAPIEVFKIVDGSAPVSLGVMQPDTEKTYSVEGTTAIWFKNLSLRQAQIKIKLVGDKNLSMGYKE
jgi:hypothetical protein